MVFAPILAYFLNNMLISTYFSLKILDLTYLEYFLNKEIFILLSELHAFISSVILDGERSFKPTSTASRMRLVHSSTTTICPQ